MTMSGPLERCCMGFMNDSRHTRLDRVSQIAGQAGNLSSPSCPTGPGISITKQDQFILETGPVKVLSFRAAGGWF